jgi:hypothetical protein
MSVNTVAYGEEMNKGREKVCQEEASSQEMSGTRENPKKPKAVKAKAAPKR